MADLEKELTKVTIGNLWKTALAESAIPNSSNWRRALERARQAAIDHLLSKLSDSNIQVFERLTKVQIEELPLSIGRLAPALNIPLPKPVMELDAWQLSLMAALGSFFGILCFGVIGRLLDLEGVGLFVGGWLGGALAVWASVRLASDAFLKKLIALVLGGAIAGEALLVLLRPSSIGQVFSLIRGATTSSIPRRWVSYVLVAIVLMLSRRKPRFDRLVAESSIRAHIQLWVRALLANVSGMAPALSDTPSNQSIEVLIPTLNLIRGCTSDQLAPAIEQLFTEINNKFGISFSVPEKKAAGSCMVWQPELATEYDVFTHVEPGTRVRVTRPPVRSGEKILQKGLVREDFGSA